MKAAIVKINYELIDEIIRESFGMNLMPETDRAIFYRYLRGGFAFERGGAKFGCV